MMGINGMESMMNGSSMGGMIPMMIIGGIVMMLGIILLGAVIYLVLKVAKKTKRKLDESPKSDALEVLKMKYVSGQISEDEYEKKRRFLGENN